MPYYYVRRSTILPDGSRLIVLWIDNVTYSSPKVAGKLRLEPQSHSFRRAEVSGIFQMPSPDGSSFYPVLAANEYVPPPNGVQERTDIIAADRWRSRLKGDNASLAVTLASWRQSRDMIVKRTTGMGNRIDAAYDHLSRNPKKLWRLRRQREPLANLVLEGFFGWAPFFGDIADALTVVSNPVPGRYVSGRARSTVGWVSNLSSGPNHHVRYVSGQLMSTYSAKMTVANPNLWLANRLGLINLPGAAWDLVPWSFVVNMFTNANSLISSVSTEVGLSVSHRSLTRSWRVTVNEQRRYTGSNPTDTTPGPAGAVLKEVRKDRYLNAPPPVGLVFKAPKLDWSLATIASALLLQKAKRLSNLISL